MSTTHPLAGAPDFVIALRNALEQQTDAYRKPPNTGGKQISSRVADDRLALIDAIAEISGWNRNAVLNALADRGLFELFGLLSDDVVRSIVVKAGQEIAPTFDPSTQIARDVAAFDRVRLSPEPQIVRPGLLNAVADKTWVVNEVNPARGMIDLHDQDAGWRLSLHTSHVERVIRDTPTDQRNGLRNAILSLTVTVVLGADKKLSLVPLKPLIAPVAPESAAPRRRRG
jgi:hypothetical protein